MKLLMCVGNVWERNSNFLVQIFLPEMEWIFDHRFDNCIYVRPSFLQFRGILVNFTHSTAIEKLIRRKLKVTEQPLSSSRSSTFHSLNLLPFSSSAPPPPNQPSSSLSIQTLPTTTTTYFLSPLFNNWSHSQPTHQTQFLLPCLAAYET